MPSIKLMTKLTISEYQALIAGIPKYCASTTFNVAGQTLTATQAVGYVAAFLATVTAVETARTEVTNARQAEANEMAQNGQIVKGIRDSIAVQFSNNATTLAEFMITPRKPYTPLSIAARAAADAKAKATREARGTTSKKQKAQISGNVTGVTITPITTGTAAASTAPSSSAPSGTVTVGPVATGTAATSSGAPHS